MEEAHKRDSLLNSKFWFRQKIMTDDSPACCETLCDTKSTSEKDCKKNSMCSQLSIDTIVNGKVGKTLQLFMCTLSIYTYCITG